MDAQAPFARLGGVKPVVGDEFIPMPEAEIVAVEEHIGGPLPEAYRKYLATYGASSFRGASLDNPWIVFRPLSPLPPHISQSGKGLFDAFYGTGKDDRDPYSLRVRIRFFLGRMPTSIIPIGDDGGAGQICLGIKGIETAKVYYWDQSNETLDKDDLEDHLEPVSSTIMFHNVHLIARSFDDFLRRLETKD